MLIGSLTMPTKQVAQDADEALDRLAQTALGIKAERDRLRAVNAELVAALEFMVAQEVDYMTINHLGNPEEQHGVRMARAALSKARGA